MSKFNLGDKVKIREDLVLYAEYNGGCCVIEDMMCDIGKESVIRDIINYGTEPRYSIENSPRFWSDDMLYLIPEEEINIEVKEECI